MGKLTGLIQFTGKFDGLSFYEMNGKIVVRKTGGFDGEKIKTSPNYIRVRENSTEFAQSAKAGKYFRDSISLYLKKMRIPYVHNRVLGLFHEISRLDLVSVRGKRSVFNGVQSAGANGIIERFEFDKNLSFDTVFPFKYTVNKVEGKLMVPNFSSALLKKPKGTTHISLQFIMVGLDFELQTSFTQNLSAVLIVALNDHLTTDLELTCELPQSPVVFGMLYLEFLQKINETNYSLKSGCLKIASVDLA